MEPRLRLEFWLAKISAGPLPLRSGFSSSNASHRRTKARGADFCCLLFCAQFIFVVHTAATMSGQEDILDGLEVFPARSRKICLQDLTPHCRSAFRTTPKLSNRCWRSHPHKNTMDRRSSTAETPTTSGRRKSRPRKKSMLRKRQSLTPRTRKAHSTS